MTVGFLLGGGRQRADASLTLWKMWPRWSIAAALCVSSLLMGSVYIIGLPLPAVGAVQVTTGAATIAALLRAVSE